MDRRIVFAVFVAGAMLLCDFAATAQTASDMAALKNGYIHATYVDEPTRRFVELYLRIAGGIWIAAEWVAAIFLMLGYRRLARWFSEDKGRG